MTQDEQLPEGFGSGNYSGNKYEKWSLKNTKDGDIDRIIFRSLPPMKNLAKSGAISKYWKTHFGWKGRNQQDPEKLDFRMFLCVEDKDRNGMVVSTCPACEYIAEKKQEYDALKSQVDGKTEEIKAMGKKAGKTPAEIARAIGKMREPFDKELKPLGDWLYDHNAGGKVRMLGINQQGQYGVLSLPYGTFKKLNEEIKKLKSNETYPGTTDQVDPTGRNGVFFEIVRSGKPSKDSDSVRPLMESRADGAKMLVFNKLTNEQLKTALAVLPDLVDLMNEQRIKPEQIQALVGLDKLGGGQSDPDEVDKILEIGKAAAEPEDEEPDWMKGPEVPPSTPANPPAPTPEPAKPEVKAESPKPAEKAPETQPTTVNGADLPASGFEDLWS